MSKRITALIVLNAVLICLILGQGIYIWIHRGAQNGPILLPERISQGVQSGKCSVGWCGSSATTLLSRTDIPGDKQFHPTGLTLAVEKTQGASFLFYTCQITFQFDTPATFGARFKMRVKDSSGSYIMPDMETGAVSSSAHAYRNAMLSDMVYHTGVRADPPPGVYTFELWALAGGGTLTIVPFMSNIAVLELPRQRVSSLTEGVR